jgi:hypothetical protein
LKFWPVNKKNGIPYLIDADHISPKVFSRFNMASNNGTLPKMCLDLFAEQQSVWNQMLKGYADLEFVKTREVVCKGFTVKLQFNPGRIISTGANTNPQAIKERECFLCLEHLPELQKGILYCNEYLVLCNPMPIFTKHFTISDVRHTPQNFELSVEVMLNLARDLSPDFTVFYNGPKCGASAPDHLHFQASPRLAIPVECDAVDVKRRKHFYYREHVAGFTLTNYGRTVVIIESTDKQRLLEFLQTMLIKWKKILHLSEEPMMNVLGSYQEELWRLIIFPRRKHRPDLYYKNGDERLLVSPAAVDIGGLIVTPLEKDFARIDAKLVEDIFSEVSEKQEIVSRILEALV